MNYKTYEDVIKADQWDYCNELEELADQLSYEPIRYRRTRKAKKERKEEEE